MSKYELMFILDPTLEESAKDDAIDFVKGVVAAEGDIKDVDVWGKRKLAYPIQKHGEGFYVLVDFEAQTEAPREIDRRLKISDKVIRHMIINKEEK